MNLTSQTGSQTVTNSEYACATTTISNALNVARLDSLCVIEARNPESMKEHLGAWEDLTAAAVEPNVFYEPWMLLPAVDAYGVGQRLRFLFIYVHDSRAPQSPRTLCGFFPLVCRSGFRHLPISVVSLWQHVQCFLCVPLIRPGFVSLCFGALHDWLVTSRDGGSLLELPYMTGEGPTHEAMSYWLKQRQIAHFVVHDDLRAFLRRGDPEGFVSPLSSNRRKKLQRQGRQLQQLGELNALTLGPGDNVETWIDNFLTLESAGWKGRQGTALACNERDRIYFQRIAREAHRRGRLRMLAMNLNGRRIAQLCDFVAGDGIFSFKIAYDESFGDYSPGVLLDLENLRLFHQDQNLTWADSCNAPGPSSLMDLWPQRRRIQTLLLTSGNGIGNLLVAAAPWVRKLRQSLRSYLKPGEK